MAQHLVVDVPEHIAVALTKRAAENGRTPEDEHRAILEDTFGKESGEDFWDRAAKWREKLSGRKFTPSEDLIRETRDER